MTKCIIIITITVRKICLLLYADTCGGVAREARAANIFSVECHLKGAAKSYQLYSKNCGKDFFFAYYVILCV